MKTFALFACLVTLNLAFSQTKIIANKSHSGNAASLALERDGNFGIAPSHLDSVFKISDSCIVEINNWGWRDTVYNHPYFCNPAVTIEQMHQEYPRIIFVGFEQKGKVKPVKTGKSNKQRKGSLYLLGFLAAGSLMYTFFPKRKSVN